MTSRRPDAYRRPALGFTLIEMLVAVVVIGLLATVAFPTFMDAVRKSRRSEAFTAVNAVQQAQERWRANNPTYTGELTNGPAATPPGLGLDATPGSGYYTLALSSPTAAGYTVQATAVAGKSQARDGRCKLLGMRMQGGNLRYGSGETSIDWSASNPDAGRCWAR